MPEHVNILDQPEPLGKSLAGSVILHVSLFATLLLSSWLGGGVRETWGDPKSLAGGTVGINIVKQIPLPSRSGEVNPLANDTESAVPKAPAKTPSKAEKRVAEPDPDAIAIKGRNAVRRQSEASQNRLRAKPETANQLHSASGQALVSPMVGQTGSGGVGIGAGSPFGNRFGYYVDLLRQRVAEKWRTGDVDARLQTAPPVVVTFTILRDGSVRDVRIAQPSGNGVLDYSAQRAIYDATPFPQLPAGFERSEANIEFWFQLKR